MYTFTVIRIVVLIMTLQAVCNVEPQLRTNTNTVIRIPLPISNEQENRKNCLKPTFLHVKTTIRAHNKIPQITKKLIVLAF